MADNRKYVNELATKFGYHATWTPDTPLALGDIGTLNKGVFTRITNISELNFTFTTKEGESEADFEYQSQGNVSISTNANINLNTPDGALGDGKAGFDISFGKEGGVYMKAEMVKTLLIDEGLKLRKFIKDQYNAGVWEYEWIVITELKVAQNATILYSEKGNGSISICAEAQVGTDNLKITDSNANFQVVRSKGMDVKVLARKETTPLFKAVGLKRKLFGGTKVVPRGVDPKKTPIELEEIQEIAPLEQKKMRALLVGINEYQHMSENNLSGCVQDVEKVQAYLESLKNNDFEVEMKVLTNAQATKANMVSGFEDFLTVAEPHETLLFYYSGHGTQEDAGGRFNEANDKLQALVCHDTQFSRSLLSDKELRYLIGKVTANGNQLVSITDCCHSGTNMRGELVTRRMARPFQPRYWGDFIFHEEFTEIQARNTDSVEELLPIGNYIHFAACESGQSSYELRGEGGVFTSNFIKVLEQTSGDISYWDLHRRVKMAINNWYQQNPVMEFSGDEDQVYATVFAGGGKGKADRFNLSYDRYNQLQSWVIDAGALHGLSKQCMVEVIDEEESIVTTVSINSISLDKAKVSPTIHLDYEKTYSVRINGLLKSGLSLLLEGDAEGTNSISNFFHQADNQQPSIEWVLSPNTADYIVQARNGNITIVDPVYRKPVARQISGGYNDESNRSLQRYLTRIAQWKFVKTLRNPNQDHISSLDQLEVDVSYQDADNQNHKAPIVNNSLALTYQHVPDWSDMTDNPYTNTYIKLKNNFNQNLYVALIGLNADFGIFPTLLTGGTELLESGAEITSLEGQALPISQEKYIGSPKYNWKEESIYMLVIASTEQFDATTLSQQGVPHPIVEQAKGFQTAGRGFFGRTQPSNPFWFTRLIEFNLDNPYYQEEEAGETIV